MIDKEDTEFLRLLQRSPDRGEGWRTVSKQLWPLVEMMKAKELIEVDQPNLRIRLSERGKAVVDYVT